MFRTFANVCWIDLNSCPFQPHFFPLFFIQLFNIRNALYMVITKLLFSFIMLTNSSLFKKSRLIAKIWNHYFYTVCVWKCGSDVTLSRSVLPISLLQRCISEWVLLKRKKLNMYENAAVNLNDCVDEYIGELWSLNHIKIGERAPNNTSRGKTHRGLIFLVEKNILSSGRNSFMFIYETVNWNSAVFPPR